MKAIYLLATVAILSSCNSNGGGSGKKDTVVIVEKEHGKSHERHRSYSAASESADNSNSSGASTSPSTSTAQPTDAQPTASQPAAPQKKKGWSAAAKDATIGGAAGAVAGALIDKNSRVVGGVLGGALGAGAGYLIGRSRDRKTGRVVKHQSAEYTNSN